MSKFMKTWEAPFYKISIIKIAIYLVVLIPFCVKPEIIDGPSVLVPVLWVSLITFVYKKFDKVKYDISFPYNKQLLFFHQVPAVYSVDGETLIINSGNSNKKVNLTNMEGFSRYVGDYDVFCVLPQYKVLYLHKKLFFLKQYKPIVVPIEQEEEIKEVLSKSIKFLDKDEALKDQKPNCFVYFMIIIISLVFLAIIFLFVSDLFFNKQF